MWGKTPQRRLRCDPPRPHCEGNSPFPVVRIRQTQGPRHDRQLAMLRLDSPLCLGTPGRPDQGRNPKHSVDVLDYLRQEHGSGIMTKENRKSCQIAEDSLDQKCRSGLCSRIRCRVSPSPATERADGGEYELRPSSAFGPDWSHKIGKYNYERSVVQCTS